MRYGPEVLVLLGLFTYSNARKSCGTLSDTREHKAIVVPPNKQQQPGLHIQWTTITYRSVFLAILALVSMVGIVMYFAFPEPTKAGMDKVGSWIGPIVDRWAGKSDEKKTAKTGEQDAHFTNIDGTVK